MTHFFIQQLIRQDVKCYRIMCMIQLKRKINLISLSCYDQVVLVETQISKKNLDQFVSKNKLDLIQVTFSLNENDFEVTCFCALDLTRKNIFISETNKIIFHIKMINIENNHEDLIDSYVNSGTIVVVVHRDMFIMNFSLEEFEFSSNAYRFSTLIELKSLSSISNVLIKRRRGSAFIVQLFKKSFLQSINAALLKRMKNGRVKTIIEVIKRFQLIKALKISVYDIKIFFYTSSSNKE